MKLTKKSVKESSLAIIYNIPKKKKPPPPIDVPSHAIKRTLKQKIRIFDYISEMSEN